MASSETAGDRTRKDPLGPDRPGGRTCLSCGDEEPRIGAILLESASWVAAGPLAALDGQGRLESQPAYNLLAA